MSASPSFDFIVVGTGSGGGTMIARLVTATNGALPGTPGTVNSSPNVPVGGFSVLALEAGGDFPTPTDRRKEMTQITADEELNYDWPYIAESVICGYGFRIPETDQSMGRMVGGSGNHFGYICYRGTPEDYQEWDYGLIDGGTVATVGVGRLTGTVNYAAPGFPAVAGTGTIWAGTAATGTITTVVPASLVDGETFQLNDGIHGVVTFEFDVTGAAIINPDNIPVDVSGDATANDVRDTIIGLINGLAAGILDITAADGGAATVDLTNDLSGPGVTNATAGNTASEDAVADVGFVLTDMAGAIDSELAVGDYMQSTEQSAAWPVDFGEWKDATSVPLRISAIASATALTLVADPLGAPDPVGAALTIAVKNTIWSDRQMNDVYKAIEDDIDFGGNQPFYGPTNAAAHGDGTANGGIGVTHIGRLGAQRVPGLSAPPATLGDTRANVTTPRIQNPFIASMQQLTNSVLNGPAFSWIDDRNNGLKNPSRNCHKYPKNEIGFDNDGVPVAGGMQLSGIFHLNKYDERRSQLIVAIDPIRAFPNFTLEVSAVVDRVILQEQDGGQGPGGTSGFRAVGVEYIVLAADGTQTRKTALSNNVILSAGPFGTPAILLRSGIGPNDRLAPFGIPQQIDLPAVGADALQHTISVGNIYILKDEFSLVGSAGVYGIQYASRYTSPVGLITADPENPRNKFAVGTPKVLFDNDNDIQVFVGGGAGNENAGITSTAIGAGAKSTAYGNAFVIVGAGFKPRSRGDGVRLRSTSPFDVPIIHDGRLQDPLSLDAEAYLDFFEVIDSKMTDAFAPPALPFQDLVAFNVPIPSTIEAVCGITTGAFHVVSTCKMGVPTDPRAVCDRYGRVLDVQGLACSDNSIYPTHTRANPAWPTVAHSWAQANVFIANGAITP